MNMILSLIIMNNNIKFLSEELSIKTSGQFLYEITKEINAWLKKEKINQGLLVIFIQHTSASLIIQENASHDVLEDISNFFSKLVPEDNNLYKHTIEGIDDMPAHIKSLLTQTSLTIPIENNQMVLGTWQGIFLYEHRRNSYNRKIKLSFFGK